MKKTEKLYHMKCWQRFMYESNSIEREERLNPGDEKAFNCACNCI